ncbi:E-selectin-like [Halichondria panicea]|uniref:E-selectin-like n=1 Tax=Halichondria panicea TaxID=6063 RepID=UPI00312B2C51
MSVNGSFNGTAPTCDPITCSTVAIPNNGSLDFGGASPDVRNNYALNVVATYNCDNGFSLVGDRTRMCTGEGSSSSIGTFDGVDPTCEPITCPSIPSTNNGSIDFGRASPNENSTYAFNVVATYNCDTGFSLVGDNTRNCTGDGNSIIGAFDGSAPNCQLITCFPLTDPFNGFVTYSSTVNSNYVFDVVATYSCDTGFFLVGNDSRTCTGDGSSITGAFDGLVPSCEAITCPSLSNPTNGSVSYSNVPDQNNRYSFNVTATYSCNSGFTLVGNKIRNCFGDGSSTTGLFDGLAPACKATTCSPLADLLNGTISYSAAADGLGNYVFNVTANHSCDTGFDLVGNNPRTCSGDGSIITGTFDGEAPSCEPAVASSSSLIRDVVVPVVSVMAVLALVVLGGAVYGYIKVISHLFKLQKAETGTAKLL